MAVKILNFARCIPKVNDERIYLVGTEKKLLSVNSLLQKRYLVAILGFLLTIVSHAQRMNISIAMVAMVKSTTHGNTRMTINASDECSTGFQSSTDTAPSRGEFLWSPLLQSYIVSVGYLGCVITQIPAGILVKRFGAKRALVSSLVVSSVCNLLSPYGSRAHPYILLLLTLIRGLAQGFSGPCLYVMMARWFPRNERGFLSTFVMSGFAAGVFITGLVGGRLCGLEVLGGWPLVFYAFGLLGLFLSLLFLIFFYDAPEKDPRITKAELLLIQSSQGTSSLGGNHRTPWKTVFTSIPVYALIIALFGNCWLGFYGISVHPMYLGGVLHLPVRQVGEFVSYPHIIKMIGGFCTCTFSFWLSRRTKIKVDTMRKGFNTFSSIVAGLGLVGILFAKCDVFLNELFTYIIISGCSCISAGALIAIVDMTPTFCGPLTGVVSTLATLSGFMAHFMVGTLMKDGESLTQWGKVFLISAGISIGSALIFQFLGSAEVQPWDPLYAKPSIKSKEESEAQESKPTEVPNISKTVP